MFLLSANKKKKWGTKVNIKLNPVYQAVDKAVNSIDYLNSYVMNL